MTRPVAWLWIGLVLVPPAVFLAGTPYAVLDLPAFLDGAGLQAREYGAVGHGRATVESGLPHLARQVARLHGNLGTVSLLVAIAGVLGMAVGRAGRSGRLALLFPALYLIGIASTRIDYHRNVLPVYPFLAAAFGCGGVVLHQLASGAASRRLPPRLASGGAALLLGAVAAVGALALAPESYRAWATAESRTRAAQSLGERLAGAASRPAAGIASEVRVHPDDLRRLAAPVTSASLVDLICERPAGLGLVLAGARHAVYYQEMAADVEAMDALLPVAGSSDRIEGKPLTLDIFSVNPALVLFDPAEVRSRTGCGEVLRAADLGMGPNASVESGAVELLPGGSFSTPPILSGPGRHALFVRGRTPAGRRVSRVGLTVRIAAMASGLGGQPEERVVVMTSELSTHAALFEPPPSGVATITVQFPWKPPLPALGRADRVLIETLRLVRLPAREE